MSFSIRKILIWKTKTKNSEKVKTYVGLCCGCAQVKENLILIKGRGFLCPECLRKHKEKTKS